MVGGVVRGRGGGGLAKLMCCGAAWSGGEGWCAVAVWGGWWWTPPPPREAPIGQELSKNLLPAFTNQTLVFYWVQEHDHDHDDHDDFVVGGGGGGSGADSANQAPKTSRGPSISDSVSFLCPQVLLAQKLVLEPTH